MTRDIHRVFSTIKLIGIVIAAWAAGACAVRADVYGYVDARGAVYLTNTPAPQPYVLYAREPDTAPDLAAGAHAPAGPAVPAQDSRYRLQVEQAAREFQIDAALIYAIIQAESAYRPRAVSRKGAIGLMQVMPQTAARYGTVNLLDPGQNIYAGVKYLRTLGQLFNGNLELVLAAYNAGEQAVMRYGNRIPPYPETIVYVARVTSLYRRYQQSS